MRTAKVLAENLNRLMEESAGMKTVKGLHAHLVRLNCEISTGTIDRIRRAEISTSVDNLAALGRAFDLEPWQMLVPGIKAHAKADPAFAANSATEVARMVAAEINASYNLTPKGGNIQVLPDQGTQSALRKSREQKARSRGRKSGSK